MNFCNVGNILPILKAVKPGSTDKEWTGECMRVGSHAI